MRWDALALDGPEPALFRRPVTIDTPEFRGITFHEITAKSIINRVPGASRMPFTWTINPYRGCSHSCTYCSSGDTPILMADGRTKPLRDLKVGDAIYGTKAGRYVVTGVLDHWRTVKPAYRVTLDDGTELITSGDHRFLSDGGWKHVTGAERPHLTLGDRLMGVGRFAEPPKKDADYRLGYLCGAIRGGGHRGHGRSALRLAPIDQEAVRRSHDYLTEFGVPTSESVFPEAARACQEVRTIRTDSAAAAAQVERLTAWPGSPSDEWRKGFLAGVFDAEGGREEADALRISNADPLILSELHACLHRLGFDFVTEPGMCVRLRGGLRERLRFFHTVDPAITRKRSIEGVAIKSDAALGVKSIEPVGLDLPLYDITTGTGDFIADGVVSHNCFARKTHEYLDFDSGADFDSQIVVKVNAAELVRRELGAAKWRGEHIAMGTNVDCYQRAEGRYRLMPGIIGALRDAANPFSILTKGSLILRDLPLLCEAAERAEVGAAVSVGSVDKELWRLAEPGTPSPLKRLEVCAKLNEAGIGCGVLMGPIVPYLSDTPRKLEETIRLIAEAGATSVSPIVLHLRPGAREWFMIWLREHHPELVRPYQRLYGRGAYTPKDYQARITGKVKELAAAYGIGRRKNPRKIIPTPRPPEPQQLSLL